MGLSRLLRRSLTGLAMSAAAAPSLACPSIEQAMAETLAQETRARADVTERFLCLFPEGMTYNDAALTLESGGFDIPSPIERLFHRWPIRGEEFAARRRFSGFWSAAEIRITFHMVDGRLARFSAQYFSGR